MAQGSNDDERKMLHDLSNPLSIASFLAESLAEELPDHPSIVKLRSALERMNQIVKARKGEISV